MTSLRPVGCGFQKRLSCTSNESHQHDLYLPIESCLLTLFPSIPYFLHQIALGPLSSRKASPHSKSSQLRRLLQIKGPVHSSEYIRGIRSTSTPFSPASPCKSLELWAQLVSIEAYMGERSDVAPVQDIYKVELGCLPVSEPLKTSTWEATRALIPRPTPHCTTRLMRVEPLLSNESQLHSFVL
jgi:hypothetical protein